jgi:hypothetical protein
VTSGFGAERFLIRGLPELWRSARYARHLIRRTVVEGGAETVFLPALYCPAVTSLLLGLGTEVRFYDLDTDLNPNLSSVLAAAQERRSVLVVPFLFGLARPPPAEASGRCQIVIDACHALRTVVNLPESVRADWALVVSMRKEFGWSSGALAWGPHAGDRPNRTLSSGFRLALTELEAELEGYAHRAAAESAQVANILAGLLPGSQQGEVLTHLPLLSADRDASIERLRAKGLGAWCWRGCRARATANAPVARRILNHLLLVPTRHGGLPRELLQEILAESLLPWSSLHSEALGPYA